MHREVTHNRFHPNFGHFVDAVFDWELYTVVPK